jgi:hypothetical protein
MKVVTCCLFALLLFFSCNSAGNDHLWPVSTGRPGEVLLIVEDKHWQNSPGDELRAAFESQIYGLPRAEPIFDLYRISPNAFSNLFETNRNIIRIDISQRNIGNIIVFRQNVWAKPQIVIDIKAKNDSVFSVMFRTHQKALIDSILLSDQQNYLSGFRRFSSNEVKRFLKPKGIDLQIPEGFLLHVNKKDFAWIEYGTSALTQGLLVFFSGYNDSTQLRKKYLLRNLNQMLKENVPGPAENSYMQVDSIIEPEYHQVDVGKKPGYKICGLWNTINYAMGGSYTAYAIPDSKHQRIIYLYGFVYAPTLKHRNYLRQLDAIINSLEINELANAY